MLAKNIWLGMRPATLIVGLSPVILGVVVGLHQISSRGGEIGLYNYSHALVSIFLVILMQGAANLVNDVKDAESGVDSKQRSGPLRIVASGLVAATTVRNTYRLFFALSILLSAYLAIEGGAQILLLGIACCLFAFAYTGGPKPLSHFGLGELVAFVFFGPVAVAGSALLQTGSWSFEVILMGMGPGFLAAAIMAVNNHRDRQTDKVAGKRTLATRVSPELSQQLPWIFVLIAVALSIVPYLLENQQSPLKFMLPIILLLIAQKMIKRGLSGDAEKLNQTLKRIAQYELIYTVFIVGAVLL